MQGDCPCWIRKKRTRSRRAKPYDRGMDGSSVLTRPSKVSFAPDAAQAFDVVVASVVFRVVRGALCIGLPFGPADAGEPRRIVPSAAPDAREADGGLANAARNAAARVVGVKDIVRISNAGVRAMPSPGSGARARLALISWAIARPVVAGADAARSLEAEETFVPLSALPELDNATRSILSCAFDAFIDATLADALTRRLLPRHILFRKTDGFTNRSPFESALEDKVDAGATMAPAAGTISDTAALKPAEAETPIFVGLLPDPFPLSSLRELYERLLGAPLDRGNFRRQFHEIIALGPIQALPIFERGVPHRAGQLFTFDKSAWSRFASSAT